VTEPTIPDPPPDPRYELGQQLLLLASAAQRARRDLDVRRQALVRFERYDEAGIDSRVLALVVENAERAIDVVIREAERASAGLSADAFRAALAAAPELPAGEEPKS